MQSVVALLRGCLRPSAHHGEERDTYDSDCIVPPELGKGTMGLLERCTGSCELESSAGRDTPLRKSSSASSVAGSGLITAAWQRQPQQQQQPQQQPAAGAAPQPAGPPVAAAAQQQPPRTATPASEDMASTSYPTNSWWEGCDGGSGGGREVMSATVTMAREAEGALDFVLEGSAKSAGVLFRRYDMDLDGRLRKQDLYDLLLELNLALPYADYQRLIDLLFSAAARDGSLGTAEFVPLYKLLCRARRAFKRQDHHWNGQIDRYDFVQVLVDLGVLTDDPPPSSDASTAGGRAPLRGAARRGAPDKQQQQQQQQQQGMRVRELVEHGFSIADRAGRGTVNFGQVLCWFAQYLTVQGGVPPMDENGDVLDPPPSGLSAPSWAR